MKRNLANAPSEGRDDPSQNTQERRQPLVLGGGALPLVPSPQSISVPSIRKATRT